MKIKLEITKQDFRDLETIYKGLSFTAEYIVELVGSNNLEEHHIEMLESIEASKEWIKKIK